MSRGKTLPRSFFERETEVLARDLIGCRLVHHSPAGETIGRIVETEAYLSEGDPASHSHRGETPRNRSMFGRPGLAYVYLIYGMHLCLNVVSAEEGRGEAVLIRALEPLEGLDLMRLRRGRDRVGELCSGPAKLTRAMGVTREHDGVDLRAGVLELWSPGLSGENRGDIEIAVGPRIGISRGTELPLRFRGTVSG